MTQEFSSWKQQSTFRLIGSGSGLIRFSQGVGPRSHSSEGLMGLDIQAGSLPQLAPHAGGSAMLATGAPPCGLAWWPQDSQMCSTEANLLSSRVPREAGRNCMASRDLTLKSHHVTFIRFCRWKQTQVHPDSRGEGHKAHLLMIRVAWQRM